MAEALRATIKTGALPKTKRVAPKPPASLETSFSPDGFILGGPEHLQHFEAVVGAAKNDVFVLSTFVAAQNDQQGRDNRERLFRALEDACQRRVRCHLFFGTSIDRSEHAIAMGELATRLSSNSRTRGFLFAHRDSVESHAKLLAADDGNGGVVVTLGSCNWLYSPFSAVELSAELRENLAAARGLDLLQSIVSSVASAKRSVDILQFMSSELKRNRSPLVSPASKAEVKARLRVVEAPEHDQLLRQAAHDAASRFVCCTNKMGANMVPALFNPAEIAGRRLHDVRVYYSRYTGPTKKRHVRFQQERLNGVVDVIAVKNPQVHAKFLAWDDDHVIVSSINWGSQSGSPERPLDEIGLYFQGANLATAMLKRFELLLERE